MYAESMVEGILMNFNTGVFHEKYQNLSDALSECGCGIKHF